MHSGVGAGAGPGVSRRECAGRWARGPGAGRVGRALITLCTIGISLPITLNTTTSPTDTGALPMYRKRISPAVRGAGVSWRQGVAWEGENSPEGIDRDGQRVKQARSPR